MFAINHTSYLDAPTAWVALALDVGFLATAGLFRIPVLSGILRLLRCVPVNRHAAGQRGAHDGMFDRVKEARHKKRNMCIFPQGGIVKDPKAPIKIKRGIVVIAHVGYPIVPVVMRGVRGSFPWRRCVEITIHPAIYEADDVRDTLAKLYA